MIEIIECEPWIEIFAMSRRREFITRRGGDMAARDVGARATQNLTRCVLYPLAKTTRRYWPTSRRSASWADGRNNANRLSRSANPGVEATIWEGIGRVAAGLYPFRGHNPHPWRCFGKRAASPSLSSTLPIRSAVARRGFK
jgi:hypothetical protein